MKNLEISIAGYKISERIFTRDSQPENWAATQNNLALAYSNKISGNRAENLEMAIAAFQQALQVYTREAVPIDWAGTQNNLGTAYSQRIKGDKAETGRQQISDLYAIYMKRCHDTLHIESMRKS